MLDRLLKFTLTFLIALFIPPPPTSAQSTPSITVQPYVSGFNQPLNLAYPPDDSNRLFVIEQAGQIRVIQNDALIPTPFLNISSKVSCCYEQGLLSMAFPPNFSSTGRFYVNYTDTAGSTVIARYQISSQPNQANPDSEQIILKINQPSGNHNGGNMEFGPDGYLYIGMGDGGGSGDPNNLSQNKNSHFGKMLRIDPESSPTYSVPASNPFVNDSSAKPKIWALGLRNPWQFSFDPETGDLYIADVGQNRLEEVNFQPANSSGGENYGWRIMEGTSCFNPSSCSQTGLTLPITEYNHDSGCSITGGVVYRGSQYPQLYGVYLYGDFCSGQIWGLNRTGSTWTNSQLLETQHRITSFSHDQSGRIFFTDFATNTVYEIVGTTTSTPTLTPTPELTPTPTPTPPVCPADINGDGIIDLTDYSILAANFLLPPATNPRSDINQDSIVDLTDYSILASFFLQTCS